MSRHWLWLELVRVSESCVVYVTSYATFRVTCFFFFSSAAVAALLQSPLVRNNAGVAEAACRAVCNLAVCNVENQAKLGAAGVCEGGYPA